MIYIYRIMYLYKYVVFRPSDLRETWAMRSDNRQTLEQLQLDKTKLLSSWFSRSRISRCGQEQTLEQSLFAHLSGLQEMKEGMSYELPGLYGFPFGASKVKREQGHARQTGLVRSWKTGRTFCLQGL